MKKFGLFLGIIGLLFLFGACDSGSGSKSISDKCKSGLTKECLEGTWLLPALINNDETNSEYAVFNIPAELTLSVADAKNQATPEEFEFKWSPDSEDYQEHGCETVYGTWSISNNKLSFQGNIGDCMLNFSTGATVDVTTLALDSMHFNTVATASTNISLKEIFTRKATP
ncbi:MAG: hypothetical protein LBR60_05700 [Fibrobacter sp.]|nr:hypothetical protein [Fibrobacter sp.]